VGAHAAWEVSRCDGLCLTPPLLTRGDAGVAEGDLLRAILRPLEQEQCALAGAAEREILADIG